MAEKTDKAIVTTNLYNPMGCLRQALNGSVVTISTTEPERLTAKNFPLTITIDLEDVDTNSKIPSANGFLSLLIKRL